MRKIIIYVSGIISLLVSQSTFADYIDWFSRCGFWNYGMWFWYIFLFIFLLIIVSFIVLTTTNNNKWNNDAALDILKKRLANGEILENEYDSLKNKLSEKSK